MLKFCNIAGCLVVTILVTGALFFSSARGQDKDDQKAAMDSWQKSMTPVKEHEALAQKVGSWKLELVEYSSVGEMKSKASAEIKMLMGGRYQEVRIKGNMMGQPFEGCSTTAFDTMRQIYVNTWIDNMGTNITTSEGKAVDDKTIEMKGQMVDPATGKMIDFRSVLTNIDADHFNYDMYFKTNGQEKKVMSTSYSRVK